MKFLWDRYKSHMIIAVLSAMLLPKEKPPSVSKAEKTLSQTMLIPYHYNGSEYTMIVPVRKRKVRWDICIAHLDNGETIHVTDEVRTYAGPNGDFMSIQLKAHQIVRNAKTLHFYKMKGKNQDRVFSIE